MYRIGMIFTFCVLRYWTHVVWSFYPSLKYMFTLIYHGWGKICVSLNADASYWPLLQRSLRSFSLPNPSSSKLKLIWSIRSISLHDGRGVLFWDINRDFSLPPFSCCSKSFTTLVSASHSFGVESRYSPEHRTLDFCTYFWNPKHYFGRVRYVREKSCF